jgi:DNA-binding ferritin-like protein
MNTQTINITTQNLESTLDNTRNFGLFLNKILAGIKMFHWYTLNYNFHIVTDDLYKNLSKLIDTFMEELIEVVRTQNIPFNINIPEIQNFDNCQTYQPELQNFTNKYNEISYTLMQVLNSQEFFQFTQSTISGINNVKEEILSLLNKTSYLLNQIKE